MSIRKSIKSAGSRLGGLFGGFGGIFSGGSVFSGKRVMNYRNMWQQFRLPHTPEYQDFNDLYYREGLAKRLIDAPVLQTWNELPFVGEDEEQPNSRFCQKLRKVSVELNMWEILRNAEILSRIGEFGVILAIADGKVDEPLERNKIYALKPYSQANVQIRDEHSVQNPNDPRFGLPEFYTLQIAKGTGRTSIKVHWTRIVHLTEASIDSPIYGIPVLAASLNHFIALQKLQQGHAEVFFRNAQGAMVIKSSDRAHFQNAATKKAIKDQLNNMNEYVDNKIVMNGIDVQQLSLQTPSPHLMVDKLIESIAGTYGIPKRILVGSERGQLASTQDAANWSDIINSRRVGVSRTNTRKLIDMLIVSGNLPVPKKAQYVVKFPTVGVVSAKERAETALVTANAIKAIQELNIGDDEKDALTRQLGLNNEER